MRRNLTFLVWQHVATYLIVDNFKSRFILISNGEALDAYILHDGNEETFKMLAMTKLAENSHCDAVIYMSRSILYLDKYTMFDGILTQYLNSIGNKTSFFVRIDGGMLDPSCMYTLHIHDMILENSFGAVDVRPN